MIACVVAGATVAIGESGSKCEFGPRVSLSERKNVDEFLLQLDDVSQQLQFLRSRASSLLRAHEQVLDEPEAAQRE